jgi:hypothetical protein
MAVKDGAAHFEVGSKDELQDYQHEDRIIRMKNSEKEDLLPMIGV